MSILRRPHFGGVIELSENRERHIRERHPDLLPFHRRFIETTLTDPDEVRISSRNPNARLSRWYDGLLGGKYVVIVAVSVAGGMPEVVTAYIARKLAGGKVEWQRS